MEFEVCKLSIVNDIRNYCKATLIITTGIYYTCILEWGHKEPHRRMSKDKYDIIFTVEWENQN